MSQAPLSSEWFKQFSDPYAVMGLSVAADDQRVLKRYRQIAKLLHPDSSAIANATPRDREFADKLLAHLVNPAYYRLKQEKGRAEVVALLRLRARRLSREEDILPQGELAHQLLRIPAQQVDVFYEQAIANLAEFQFQPVGQFAHVAEQLGELNVLYLHLKLGEPMVREKRTGLVSANQAKPTQFTPPPAETAQMAVSYAQRHYQRAQEYAKKGAWNQTVAELRDAIRLEPNCSEFHSLLGQAYWMQNLPGMAKVHFRQALKFNPNDSLALQYAARLNIAPTRATPAPSSTPPGTPKRSSVKGSGKGAESGGGLFSFFPKRK